MGGKPKASTPADRRLKANRTTAAKPASAAKPAFGSAAWDSKYGIKRKSK